MIKLDLTGRMNYKKVIDSQEARLSVMVSVPLIDKAEDKIQFYTKRGIKKQLVKVDFN